MSGGLMVNRKTLLKKTVSFVLWTVLFLLAVVLPPTFDYQAWSILAAVLPTILRLAYEHFDNFNLLVNRTFLWLFNQEVAWELKASLIGNFSGTDLETASHSVLDGNRSARILQDSDTEKTITISDLGITIKLSLASVRSDEDEFDKQIAIVVPRRVVPFRHNTHILKFLTRILSDLRSALDPGKEVYNFSAIFLDHNPYLGLFLKTLKLPDNAFLNVDYSEHDGVTEGRISVKKNKIVVSTSSIDSLQALSNKYIMLSSLNLSDA
jgi:hypothetical protein